METTQDTTLAPVTPGQLRVLELIEAAKQKQNEDIRLRARAQFLANAARDASAETAVKPNYEMMYDAAHALGKLMVSKTFPGKRFTLKHNKNQLKRYETRTHDPEFYATYGHYLDNSQHYGALSGNLLASEPEYVDGQCLQRSFNFLAGMGWEYIVKNPQSSRAPHTMLPFSLVMFEVNSALGANGQELARDETEVATFDLRPFLPIRKRDSKAKKPITELPPVKDPENTNYLDMLAILQLGHDELSRRP